jgi:16S rRNA (guanine527-N7)-methyltransferase
MTAAPCPPGLLATWADDYDRPVAEIAGDLQRLFVLLENWQAAQNLVSRETLGHFWTRHVADSLQVLPLLPAEAERIFDLGSGGGFPALPLAIAGKGGRRRFTLFEANQRKIAYLRTVIRALGLPATVHGGRIEAADSRETGQAQVITARALAPVKVLFGLALPLVAPGGCLLLHKGRDFGEELTKAGADWDFDVLVSQSVTDPDGVILRIDRLSRKGV